MSGLVGREIQPGRRLGSELSDYAKRCGVGGIFHTDELPAYGVTADEVSALRGALSAADKDAVVIVAADRKRALCAAQQVVRRAELAFEGVPEETRRMLEGGSSAYMRPLPGAARMYPETDILPVMITQERWASVKAPELLVDRAERYVAEHGLSFETADQLVHSSTLALFDQAVGAGVQPGLAARTVLATLKELSRDGVGFETIGDENVLAVLTAVQEDRAAKEAIPDLLRAVAKGASVDEALSSLAPAVNAGDLEALVERIIQERISFVQEKKMGALGPLMGVVMAEVRGSVDGKRIADLLRTALKEALD